MGKFWGVGVGMDPACLVGEGWWVPHGSGREVVGDFGGVGGKFSPVFRGFEAQKNRFFVHFVEIMVKIILSSSRKHPYCKFSIFASW